MGLAVGVDVGDGDGDGLDVGLGLGEVGAGEELVGGGAGDEAVGWEPVGPGEGWATEYVGVGSPRWAAAGVQAGTPAGSSMPPNARLIP